MRLWHYKLLPYLNDFHIVAQWRELLAIKGAIDKNGTPNHRLVNKVLAYNISNFKTYTACVVQELAVRCIKYDKNKYKEMSQWQSCHFVESDVDGGVLYKNWHTDRYLKQCLYNLQEKYDCGIVSQKAWDNISDTFEYILYGSNT